MLELRTRFSMLSVVGRHLELDVDLGSVSNDDDDDDDDDATSFCASTFDNVDKNAKTTTEAIRHHCIVVFALLSTATVSKVSDTLKDTNVQQLKPIFFIVP